MTIPRILAFAAAASLVVVIGLVACAWANGVRFYGVESGSMSPAMHQGDLLIDMPTSATSTYRVGDIVTFRPTPGYIVTHRIVAIGADGISTKGDANTAADLGQIPAANIVGRVVAVVPLVGAVAAFFRQPVGIAALLAVMVVIYGAWHLAADRKPVVPAALDTASNTNDGSGGPR
ncbi:MAG: signal peptidase I [Candidatus Limnocylindrales bacterium]